MSKLNYIFHWYLFVFKNKKIDIINFLLIIFFLPILPYLIVSIKLINDTDSHLRSFYGDGSIIILCSGILCSFVAMLFEYNNEKEKKWNVLINLFLIISFIVITISFVDAQINFDRKWWYIKNIIAFSGVILVLTLFSAIYLNFRINVDYVEVDIFIKERKIKKIERKANKAIKSKGGTVV